MIVLSDCLTNDADEGCIKVAASLTQRLKNKDPGITVITYRRRSSLSDLHLRLNPLFLNPKLLSLLRRKRESVLYIPFSSNTKAAVLRAFILSKCGKCRVNVLFALRWPMGPVTRKLLRYSGVNVFSLSEESHEMYRSIAEDRAFRLKAGVDTHVFTPVTQETKARLRRKYGVSPDKKVLLHVGHLKNGRNIGTILDVRPDYHVFLVTSSHTTREQDRTLRRALARRPNTTLIDTFFPDIHELYQMADVYFFPVHEAGNCIDVPLSVLEAAACNLPVVATRYGWLREFQGKEGFYFWDGGDADSLNLLLDRAVKGDSRLRGAVLEYDWEPASRTLAALLSQKPKTLHLQVSGKTGGIEILMRDYAACSKHENHFAFLWGSGEITEEMMGRGDAVTVLDVKGEGMGKTLLRLDRLCRRERYNTVIAHHGSPFLKIVLLWLKLRDPNIRILAYAHSRARDICQEDRKRGLRLRRWVHRIGFRHADGVIAISESVKSSLVDYFHLPPEAVQVIYNGTRIPPEPPRRDVPGKKLIYVGRLIPEKGVQVTLDALARLPETLSYTLDIAGDGPYRDALEQQARSLGLKQVRFLGNRPDATRLLAQADIFIHTPLWEEGFGLAIIEAMAAGCICVCSASGAIPEIITDGVDGYLVEKGDPHALADVLERVLTAPDRDIPIRAARRAGDFSIERFAGELDGYIEGGLQ